MDEREIPSFLLTDINTIDRKKLLSDLRLGLLWIFCTDGTKPFDKGEALRLQSHIKAEHEARNRKRAAKQLKEKRAYQHNYEKLCEAIAETCFEFELSNPSDAIPSGIIAWTDKIKDEKGKVLCTPRSLLDGTDAVTIGWSAPNANARTETAEFLNQLRARFENFEYHFSVPRPYTKPDADASPFAETPSEDVHFDIKLVWSPLSDRELMRKVAKIISKYKKKS